MNREFDFGDSAKIDHHCKIVATLGPSSSSKEKILALLKAGVDVFRLNFSHGDYAFHGAIIKIIRELSEKINKSTAILQDLQGPKIRCGYLIDDQLLIKQDCVYQILYGKKQELAEIIPVDYSDLVKDIQVGEKILMDDGLLDFRVIKKDNKSLFVKALEDGVLRNRKGVNFPDSQLSLPVLTEKDTRDLLFGIAHRVDAIALSFVQNLDSVIHCRKMMTALGSDIPIFAKIEKPTAVEFIDSIAIEADGLMVARGDLGVEVSVEKVPVYQQKIIAAGAKYSKPVIVATQMLESMIYHPYPTFSEITDVANAVLEGADAVMLSGEVAVGKYPVECVQKMSSIIGTVEGWAHKKTGRYVDFQKDTRDWAVNEAIAYSACETADSIKAKAIVCLTLTGSIAKLISNWRPQTKTIAISPRTDVTNRLCFQWGVLSIKNPLFYATDEMLQELPERLKKQGLVESGDTIVVTAGVPLKGMCPTNMIKICKVI